MRSIKIQIILLVVGFSTYLPGHTANKPFSTDTHILYVSPHGSDRADGRSAVADDKSTHGPFATLARARDELRRLRNKNALPAGAIVYLRGGNYELADTFQLDARDSGTQAAPIIYQAYQNEVVTLSGGRQLTDCKYLKPKILTCSTKTLKLDTLDSIGLNDNRIRGPLPPFELFANGRPLQLARWPNSDKSAPGRDTWNYISNVVKGSGSKFGYHRDTTLNQRELIDNAVIHLWPGNDWFDEYIGISNVTSNILTLSTPPRYPLQAGRRFSILNTYQALDIPGEWVYAPNERQIHIIPEQDLQDNNLLVSYLDSLIELRNTNYIQFHNITFEHSRKTAIKINRGNYNSLQHCVIRNTGGYGLRIHGGENNSLIDSEVYNTGYDGVVMHGGDRNTLTGSSHLVTGSNLHHTGRIVRTGKAALRLSGVGNIARLNSIHHTGGMAVSISGNDHILDHNDIHHACEESSDCGAVYTGRDWTFHGNIISNNRIHDIYGYGMKGINRSTGMVEYTSPQGARGVYLDDAASGFEIRQNLFYRVPGVALQIGGGRDNIIDNNIFITNGYAIWLDARWPGYPWEKTMIPRLNAVPYNGSIWRKRFPGLSKPMQHPHWPEGNIISHNIVIGESSTPKIITPFKYALPPEAIEIGNNIVWNHGKPVKVDYRNLANQTGGNVGWSQWTAAGFEKKSLVTPPLFSNIGGCDFRLNPESPARDLGIQELPTSIFRNSKFCGSATPAPVTYRYNL